MPSYLFAAGGFGEIAVAARSADMPLDLTVSLCLDAAAFSSEPGIMRSGQSSSFLVVASFGGLANMGLCIVCMVLTGCGFAAL